MKIRRYIICILLYLFSLHGVAAEIYTSYQLYGAAIDFSTAPDFFRFRIPTTLLSSILTGQIKKSIEEWHRPLGVRSVSLNSLVVGPASSDFEIALSINMSANTIVGTIACDASIGFVIPASPLALPSVKLTTVRVDCGDFGDIAAALDLPSRLSLGIQQAVEGAFAKLPPLSCGDGQPLQALTQAIITQGSICHDRNRDWLCLEISFPPGLLDNVIELVASLAPQPTGPANVGDLTPLLTSLEAIAPYKPSSRYPNYRFPVKTSGGTNPTFDEGDMIIFGSLLCTVGVQDGCDLIAHAQGPTGQFGGLQILLANGPPVKQINFQTMRLQALSDIFSSLAIVID